MNRNKRRQHRKPDKRELNEAKIHEANKANEAAGEDDTEVDEAVVINEVIAVDEAIFIDKVIAVDEAILDDAANEAIVANEADDSENEADQWGT